MSEFKKYNIEEFEKYIKTLEVSREIKLVQLHHTYIPGYKQFTGDNHIQLQSGMRNYHINTNGWSDIAQHFTIFPDGVIVTGRSMEMLPAGIKGANTGAVCIECVGNFDAGGDEMRKEQRDAIVSVVKTLIEKFSLKPENAVVYHGWWTASGKKLGDYTKGKSAKTCPGTNFFGGNTREAFEKNLLPLIKNCGNKKEDNCKDLEIRDFVSSLSSVGIVSDVPLWITKCKEDINVYWLCKKMAGFIKNK